MTGILTNTGSASISCTHCITGNTATLQFSNDSLLSIQENTHQQTTCLYGPGLIDLQINGINGIDFNTPELSIQNIFDSTLYLLSKAVTTFFPTIITNADKNIVQLLQTVAAACQQQPLVQACVGGIHLEGPFISPEPGAKGAHDAAFIKAPDWDLFQRFQDAAQGMIKIITLAPEWPGATGFIEKCTTAGIIVSIGHSLANTQQINDAVNAGARMSTHLGNGIPLMVHRHPNMMWDQLAAEQLYSCVIADGIHLPDSFIKVVHSVKSDKALVVSDATCFAGMPPGEYQRHIGGDVVLDKDKRVSLKSTPGLLAGAAKSLLENVETMLDHNIAGLDECWKMASINVGNFLQKQVKGFTIPSNDLVLFTQQKNKIAVQKVIKNGNLVYTY